MASDKLSHPLFHSPPGALDRYVALQEEDQAARDAQFRRPDPARRRLRIACNDCSNPWCCNQRVVVDFVEALAIYRWAAKHAPTQLRTAIERGRQLHARPPLDDVAFFRRRQTCPFLVGGQCAVFPVRPYRCRSHYMAGNPLKCRDQVSPSETFEMSPEPGILTDLERVADDVKFDHFIEEVAPEELAEVLHFIDAIAAGDVRWSAPRVLDWDVIE